MKTQEMHTRKATSPDFDQLDAQLKASTRRLSRVVRQCEEGRRKPRKKKEATGKK